MTVSGKSVWATVLFFYLIRFIIIINMLLLLFVLFIISVNLEFTCVSLVQGSQVYPGIWLPGI